MLAGEVGDEDLSAEATLELDERVIVLVSVIVSVSVLVTVMTERVEGNGAAVTVTTTELVTSIVRVDV